MGPKDDSSMMNRLEGAQCHSVRMGVGPDGGQFVTLPQGSRVSHRFHPSFGGGAITWSMMNSAQTLLCWYDLWL